MKIQKIHYRFILVAAFVLLISVPLLAQPKDLIPFEPNDTLEAIEFKIQHNGYSFTVNHNWVFDM